MWFVYLEPQNLSELPDAVIPELCPETEEEVAAPVPESQLDEIAFEATETLPRQDNDAVRGGGTQPQPRWWFKGCCKLECNCF